MAGGIARLWPEAARRTGASAAPPLAAAEAERFRLFESLDTWIQRIAARHPVLLVLDDLHWADRTSLLLLRHLMRAGRTAPLLLVATYRDIELDRGELAAVLLSLARDADCQRLALRGLERDAVTGLLEAVAGRPFSGRESAMARDLERETGGNPFFLLEMARHLSELGALCLDAEWPGETLAGIPELVREGSTPPRTSGSPKRRTPPARTEDQPGKPVRAALGNRAVHPVMTERLLPRPAAVPAAGTSNGTAYALVLSAVVCAGAGSWLESSMQTWGRAGS